MRWGKGLSRLWGGTEHAPCDKAEEVRLWVNGPLALTGAQPGARLQVKGLGQRKITTTGVAVGKMVTVRVSGPAKVQIPPGCRVRVQRVNGPLSVKGLQSDLHLVGVNGPVHVQDSLSVHIGQVRGPLTLRRVEGPVQGEGPRGPLTLEEVQGEVRLTSPVRGALALRQVSGDVDLAVRGDARWVGPLVPQQSVRLKVSGDLRLALPAESDVHIVAQVRGALQAPFEASKDDQGRWEATLGQGTATLDLEVGGDLELTWASPAEEPTGESETDLSEAWAEWPTEEEEAPETTPADEERLMVLRMLAAKKITVEEAERLLAALEGEG